MKTSYNPAEDGIKATREQAQHTEGKPYVVKFLHVHDDARTHEELFLCLNATSRKAAAEKFWQITGGEVNQNYLLSVTGSEGIEAWWLPKEWKFVTIPPEDERR